MLGVLFFLAVIAVLSIPVCVIVLLVQVSRLRRRVEMLERRPTVETASAAPATESAPPAPARPAPTVAKPLPTATPASPPWPAAKPEMSDPTPFARAADWLAGQWFYVAAAAALAFAGIFLVQYGAERGLLTPRMRVFAALLSGSGLIAGGEWLRRRFGDGADTTTAYLPSILSGGGIVTLMAAILGARHLYDLIGPEVALTALIAVALGAIVLGWFHGPLLVAVGLLGGTIAPFAVGGEAATPHGLHGHFALLGLIGLAVDAIRRWPWCWVSALALTCGIGGSGLLALLSPATAESHLIALVILSAAAMVLPVRRLWPNQRGAMVSEVILGRVLPRPETWLASGAILASSALVVLASDEAFWAAMTALLALGAIVALWARGARAVQDAALAPAIGMIATIALVSRPEGDATITLALIFGAGFSALAALRSLEVGRATFRLGWALAAVLAAPVMGGILHLAWDAPRAVGTYPWALHSLAVAAGLTGLAGLWAVRDGADRLRPSLAALVALVLIAYALGQVVGDAALTIAVALMAPMAAWLDAKLRLPLLSWFVLPSAVFTGWRLAADPGVDFALNGPLGIVALVYLCALAGFVVTWWLLRRQSRAEAMLVAETAAFSVAGLTVTLAIWRLFEALELSAAHAGWGFTATIWLLLATVQAERLRRSGRMRWVRMGLAGAFALGGTGALLAAIVVTNPLANGWAGTRVAGPTLLNTLLPAYFLPGAALLLAGRRLRIWQISAAGIAIAALWLFAAIRHGWQGAVDMPLDRGIAAAESLTYSLAIILVGAALFYQGVARGDARWRRAGTILLGVAAAKVFLLDAASLSGLIRVGAFVGLAAALGGLAWLDRWARTGRGADPAG